MPEQRVDIEEGRRLRGEALLSGRHDEDAWANWDAWKLLNVPAMLDELERLRAAECCGGRQCCGGGE